MTLANTNITPENLQKEKEKITLHAPEKSPMWYKGGVIYEVHVRAFQDSDGDGVGDFRGLTSRLDYLRDLGITAIWLLPFYPSPLKDDGYDISDYFGVHPMYGTLADFKLFLREAHTRGLRVITELVLNHTSDQHPWFQRARRAPTGSKFRDYYVWNDSPEKYRGARIIFKDTELSNWTMDGKAGAYYWHRFFSHQPDLNFDNSAVHEEMIKVLDFWLDLGVDGVRLDAVPYLYEREGTSCENLPETHEFLKTLRQHVDKKYGDRMLLAEANQWPEDAVAYFGTGRGDECHMAFHFPLMPRLFMSLRMEDRIPIVDILEQTPPIPETAQWALFLRNHDELTLEMVTDEERDYMYRVYAHDRQARLNLGIRRRLAPLVGNDRKRIELLTGLLFSLPGTPVIYYGDEIGMGENIYLGDRNGVRTPMQWSSDKNAGFSRASPQSLYLPINLDPENHYEAVNVEAQERNNYSLLWWTRRLIALYKRCQALGRGTIEFLHPENRKIFTCIRRYNDEIILVVANLSRFVQPVELDLAGFKSLVPIELFGRSEFPSITDRPYFLTLGPHAFYWFELMAKAATETKDTSVTPDERAIVNVSQDWTEILTEEHQLQLERVLQSWLPSRRWFDSRMRTIKTVRVRESIPIAISSAPESPTTEPSVIEQIVLTFLQVEYVQADPEVYVLPLFSATGKLAETIAHDFPPVVIARLNFIQSGQTGILYDAIVNKDFHRALLGLFSLQKNPDITSGRLAVTDAEGMEQAIAEAGALQTSVANAEYGSSNIIFGEKFTLKLFRRLDPGISPGLEILRYLTTQNLSFSPPLTGALEYCKGKGEIETMAVLTSGVPNSKNAWEYTLDALGKFYERVQVLPPEKNQPQIPVANIIHLAADALPEQAKNLLGPYIESVRQLGVRTAALHLALAVETDNRNFSPEPFTIHGQRGLFQSLRNLTRRNFLSLSRHLKTFSPEIQAQAQKVLELEPDILNRFRRMYDHQLDAVRTRLQGDYGLGKILYTGKDFLVIDFEGNLEVPVSERRLKRSPLQDIAGMVRSFHYAAYTALLKHIERGTPLGGQLESLLLWARFWERWVSAIFYKSYLQAAGKALFLPSSEADLQMMIDVFLLQKMISELGAELNQRPEWVKIPLQGILESLGKEDVK